MRWTDGYSFSSKTILDLPNRIEVTSHEMGDLQIIHPYCPGDSSRMRTTDLEHMLARIPQMVQQHRRKLKAYRRATTPEMRVHIAEQADKDLREIAKQCGRVGGAWKRLLQSDKSE